MQEQTAVRQAGGKSKEGVNHLENQNLMQVILIVIVILCGYLALLKYVFNHAANRASFPMLAVLLLVIYGGVSGGVAMVLSRLGSTEYTFMGFLMLGACGMLFASLSYLARHFGEIRKKWLAMFLMYLLVVGYLTLFNRKGANDTSILTGFPSIREAIGTRSLKPLNHMFLNGVLFMPAGFLLPMMQPKKLNNLLLATAGSAMLSVTIESVQLMLRLGQCDLEDILFNTLGGLAGILCYRLSLRFIHPDEEDGGEEDGA